MGKESRLIGLGQEQILRWETGPVSFGNMLTASVVSWSGAASKDLLVSRCWEGVYLHSSQDLKDSELNREPIKVFGSNYVPTMAWPMDWNGDGRDEIIVSDRHGFLHLLAPTGGFPCLSFEVEGPLRDMATDLVFNIPFENPNHGQFDDLGGYFDASFFNYVYPVAYPVDNGQACNLIIGDTAGNLWWLPDASTGVGPPCYTGHRYTKPDLSKRYAREYLDKYGLEYAKPAHKICDEQQRPYLLGMPMRWNCTVVRG